MKILRADATNFASYKELHFDFNDRGLVLISGPTGSGKSTLCDLVPWVLFGVTAKNGPVDEIRAWSGGDTVGTIVVSISTQRQMRVMRSRGDKGNDLWFSLLSDSNHLTANVQNQRGKDLNDTQRLINQELGLNAELFLAGAYYHEFSQTAQFFTATAKNRRALTEQLVDLSLPIDLTANLSEYKKEAKKEKTQIETKIMLRQGDLQNNVRTQASELAKATAWDARHKEQLARLRHQSETFEDQQEAVILAFHELIAVRRAELEFEIDQLKESILPEEHFSSEKAKLSAKEALCQDTTCSECGAKKDSHKRLLIVREESALKNAEIENTNKKMRLKQAERSLAREEATFIKQLAEEAARTNTYQEQINQHLLETNPHNVDTLAVEQRTLKATIKELQSQIDEFAVELADIDLLLEITSDFRMSLVKSAIIQLEKSTNALLADHFDAEIRVTFDMEDADKLEVVILKDGNQCSYTQLSKGQRQLLKLCFGVSVMRSIANHHGQEFSCAWFDEAFDGIDGTLKNKAFSLLNCLKLKFSSIFVVEHSTEMKARFENGVQIRLVDGHSEITENE